MLDVLNFDLVDFFYHKISCNISFSFMPFGGQIIARVWIDFFITHICQRANNQFFVELPLALKNKRLKSLGSILNVTFQIFNLVENLIHNLFYDELDLVFECNAIINWYNSSCFFVFVVSAFLERLNNFKWLHSFSIIRIDRWWDRDVVVFLLQVGINYIFDSFELFKLS